MAHRLVLLVGDPQFSARLNFIAAFHEGFILYWAKSLSQAQSMLGEREYHLVVVDGRSDPTSAASFCRAAKLAHSAIKVAYLTSESSARPDDCVDVVVQASDSQAEFITKISGLFQ